MTDRRRKVSDRITELEDRVRELEAERTLILAENASLKQQVLVFENELEKLKQTTKNTNENISVSLASIPEYLRLGDYYGGLVGSEGLIDVDGHNDHAIYSSQDNSRNESSAQIIVPRKCFKDNATINTIFDLLAVLESLRYWLVRRLPDSLIGFALNGQTSGVFSYIAKDFWTDMPQLLQLHNIAEIGKTKQGVSGQIIYALVDQAPREVLQYLLKHHHPEVSGGEKLTNDVAITAARLGLLEYLKFMIDHDLCKPSPDGGVCRAAAKEGHLDCLKYAYEHGCLWNESTCSSAAVGGHLDCLKYAHEQGCPWGNLTSSAAAARGHLDCLKYVHEHGCPWDESTCSSAATGGRLDCLKYAHEQGCPWDESTCTCAAMKGHLKCLQYAHEHGCPWDESAHEGALEGWHRDCLKYAEMHGCPRY